MYNLLLSLISFIVFFCAGGEWFFLLNLSFLLVSVCILFLLCALVAVSPSALFVFPVNLSAHQLIMSPPQCLQSLYFLAALCHKKGVQERIEPLLRNITLQNASWEWRRR